MKKISFILFLLIAISFVSFGQKTIMYGDLSFMYGDTVLTPNTATDEEHIKQFSNDIIVL